ncbi:MAG: hypothetical protein M1313_09545 [Nitrospirae bacterium]|nr:hypothetical protein [Nitrospirota bacterium]
MSQAVPDPSDEDPDDEEVPLSPHRKEGKGCFLVLIVLSAIPVVFFLLTFLGGNYFTYVYMRYFAVDRGLSERRPPEVDVREFRQDLLVLDRFYDAGNAGKIPGRDVVNLSSELKEMLSYPGPVRPEVLHLVVGHAREVMQQYHIGPIKGEPDRLPGPSKD